PAAARHRRKPPVLAGRAHRRRHLPGGRAARGAACRWPQGAAAPRRPAARLRRGAAELAGLVSRHLPGEAAAGVSEAETVSLGSSIAHGDSAVLAHVRRGDLVESVHHGHALVTTFPGGADGEDAAEGAVALRAGGEIEFY